MKNKLLTFLFVFLAISGEAALASEIEIQFFRNVHDFVGPVIAAVTDGQGKIHKSDASGFMRFSVPPGKGVFEVALEGVKLTNKTFTAFTESDRVTAVTVLIGKDNVAQYTIEVPIARKIQETIGLSSQAVDVSIRILDPAGRPLEKARVYLSDQEGRFESAKDGRVTIKRNPGSTMTVTMPGFQSQDLNADELKNELVVHMIPSREELETVRVLAPRIKGGLSSAIDAKRKSRGVSEVLAAEQMSKSGDGDAASSLRRVTGLTLVSGKYVYVRGLGERYSSILLNDAMISSPEPSRRVVPLDLFPTSVLEAIVVEKSYASDLPGEFGGGTIRIRTKSLPDKPFLRLAVGMNNGSDRELSYQGGALDFLGYDDGTRALPSPVAEASRNGRRLKESNPLFPDGFTPEQLSTLGRSFQNTWSPQVVAGEPMPSLQLALGERWRIASGLESGAQMAALYGTDAEYLERESNRYSLGAGGVLARDSTKFETQSTREVRTALTSDVGFKLTNSLGQHAFSTSILLLRHTENSADLETESNANGKFRSQELDWAERELLIRQAKWEGELSRWKWTLRGSLSDAGRKAPDRRSTRYIEEAGRYLFSTRADGNQRSFSALEDKNEELAIQVKKNGELQFFGKWELTGELVSSVRNRTSKLRRFHFRDVRSAGSNLDLTKPVEEILKPENIHAAGFQILETTRETDNYSADQSVRAKAFALEIKPTEKLRLVAGVRDEESVQNVVTYNLFDPSNKPVIAGLWARDILPSMVASYEMLPNQIVRFGYAETVSRPDFKELSTSPYTDEETGEEVIGNSRLRGAIIRHFDIRYENYLSSDETLSLALFQKQFDHPIEQVIRPGSDGTIRSFDNAKSANNFGLEVEGRFRLRRWSNLLRHVNIATNVSLVSSEIELREDNAGVQTSNQRPLQGQSPWATNVQLYYERSAWKFVSGLVLNMVGPRIRDAAAGGLPDVYEQPVPQLDAVFSKELDDVWTMPLRVGIRIRNLLDPEVRLTQGDETVLRYKRGPSFNINLAAVF